jgi:divalent metal cation (Fe/Co/Zn/Cd) transporter
MGMTKKHNSTNSTKVLFLEYITIAWNIVEGLVAVSVGAATGSVALVAFGLESGIEVFSSGVVVWQLKKPKQSKQDTQAKALKMLGMALLVFSLYVFITVILSLLEGNRSMPSALSLVAMACISLGMLVLGVLKKRLAIKMKNQVVLVEANLTLLDAALSGALFISLVLNLTLGWWWLDPIFALIIGSDALRQAGNELWPTRSK